MGIRPAETAGRPAIAAIVRARDTPWVEVMGMKALPMVANYGALIAEGAVYVLENGALDAIVVLRPEDGVLLVDNVAVRPDPQGRGLGRRLLAFAEFRARSLGLPALRLYTNEKMPSNIGLYESLGYRETDREAVPGASELHVVHMRKEL